MRRVIPLLLLSLLLVCACEKQEQPTPMVQPVSFYYRTAETDFSRPDGVIRAELRDLGAEPYTDAQIFQLYFQGPVSEDLISPISQDTVLKRVRRNGGTLELTLTRTANSPAEFDHSLSYACLAKTGLGLEGVRKVQITVQTPGGAREELVQLSDSDILLYESDQPRSSMDVTLYYTDEAGEFLLAEKHTVPLLDPASLPQYVLELLLAPPQSGGMRSPLPAGTAVLDVSVENGLCSVDFSRDFIANRPTTEQEELTAVLSVVNTLCELENVNQVQLYAEGQKLNPYVYLDLSTPWVLESRAVGPVRQELGEFAGTLCLPDQRSGLLHRFPLRARARGGASREEALLLALFSRSAQNGMTAPLAGVSAPVAVSTENGVCTVALEAGALPQVERARELALRAIVGTLCSLPEIEAVKITENGVSVSLNPLTPADSWFACTAAEEPPKE